MARGVDRPQAVFHDLACYFHGEFTALRLRAQLCRYCCSFELCKASAAADCNRWHKRFSTIRFLQSSAAQAFAVYGITAVLAPTVGPMLGGWITDNYSWRWIFFITLPPVLLALYLTHILVEDPPFLRRLKRGGIRVDYIGISMLTLGVGSLQVLLDKGQEDDWFGSHFITTLAITATVCLISLVVWEWFRKEPIIDVRMFKSFNFAAANLMMFMMGFMLFSTLVLIPEFLQTLMGYTAELAGLVCPAVVLSCW
jgi:MFS transporter, DHA2 family, multidrug resistance protein